MGIRKFSRTYVANSGDNTISVIYNVANRVIDTIRVDQGPIRIVIIPDGTRAYVTHLINVPLVGDIAITPDGSRV
jgi:YVTN family beta-propeller protein